MRGHPYPPLLFILKYDDKDFVSPFVAESMAGKLILHRPSIKTMDWDPVARKSPNMRKGISIFFA